MQYYYELEGNREGPVSTEQLVRLLKDGVIQERSLVWREGMEDWKPLKDAGVLEGEDGEPMAICAHSGVVRPRSEMVPYGTRWVAPEHREAFVASLMEGSSEIEGSSNVVPDRYQVDIGSLLGRSWKVMEKDFWPIVGVTLLSLLLQTAASNVPFASLIVLYPLLAGLYWYYLNQIRGRQAQVSDLFAGFQGRRFGQLVLVNLIGMLGMTVVLLPVMLPFLIGVGMFDAMGGQSSESLGAVMIVSMGVSFALLVIVTMYFSLGLVLATLLVMDRRLEFWPAIVAGFRTVNRRWFACMLFVLTTGLLSLAGMLALCIGMIVTVPWASIAYAVLYEDMFRETRQLAADDEILA